MGTLSATCPHCLHERSLFSAVWTRVFGNPRRVGLWQTYLVCPHCDHGIGAVLASTGRSPQVETMGPEKFPGNIAECWMTKEIWPEPPVHSAPAHVPNASAQRFLDGEDAFARKRWNAAVAMFRASLDLATKQMEGVPKGAFFDRLKWLFENSRITKDIREWADVVRVESNGALHDPDEFTEADAKALRYFTEMFLRYVYELPGEVKRFRGTPEPPKA